MASTYSSNLRLELITTGEQTGSWGATTNTNLGTLIEQAISGVASVSVVDGDNTLSAFNGASDESRNAVLVLTGTLTGTATLNCGLYEKVYIVKNGTNNTVTFRANSSDTGVDLATGETRILFCDGTNVYNGVNALPASSTIGGQTVVTTTATQTLTNKTLTSPTVNTPTITTPSISGGTLSGTLSGGTLSGTTLTSPTISTITNTGTITLPTSTDTLVGRATTDTLTNKTLTAPKFADSGFIADENGNELIVMDTVTSAVNEIKVSNSATGSNPIITAQGDDTNVGLNIVTKGTGKLLYNGTEVATVTNTTTSQENAQTGTTYTLVLTDAGKLVTMSNASANTLTVPPNSSVAFPVGTRVDLVQYGAGTTTVAAGSGVTIRSAASALSLKEQYSGASLWKRSTDEWVLIGALA